MRFLSILAAGFVLAACETPGEQATEQPGELEVGGEEQPPEAQASAAAELEPQNDSTVRGSVAFVEHEGELQIVPALTGLQEGEYTLTIHEGSSCDSPGALFDPDRQPEAAAEEGAAAPAAEGDLEPDDRIGHLGEFEGKKDGVWNKTIDQKDLTLQGANGVVGKVVAVHMVEAEGAPDDAEADDAMGQLVACGVVREGGTAQPAGRQPAGAPPAGEEPAGEQPEGQHP